GRPADLLRRGVPRGGAGARAGRHRTPGRAHRADAPGDRGGHRAGPGPGHGEPDLPRLREPLRHRGRAGLLRVEHPGRPGRDRTGPGRRRRGAAHRRGRPRGDHRGPHRRGRLPAGPPPRPVPGAGRTGLNPRTAPPQPPPIPWRNHAMTSAVPTAVPDGGSEERPLTMCGPDFPFGYDAYLAHPAGLGSVPPERFGTEVAVIGGGLSGLITAYELMKMGLRPVVYEADQLGGRLRTRKLPGCPDDVVAEMGAMRFPPSSTSLFHYIGKAGLRTEEFPNPLAPATPSTVSDLKGETHYARTTDDLPEVYQEVARAWNATLEEGARHTEMQRAIRERDVAAMKEIWNELVARLDNQTFYGFLCDSPAFSSFRHREIFGQVGFGTGGWDTDFPNSILEILR